MPQTKSRAGPTPTVPLGSCMCGEINDSNWLDPTVLNVRLDVPLDELARFWQGLSDASRRAVVKAPSMAELLGRAAVCSHSGGMNPDALVLLMKNMVSPKTRGQVSMAEAATFFTVTLDGAAQRGGGSGGSCDATAGGGRLIAGGAVLQLPESLMLSVDIVSSDVSAQGAAEVKAFACFAPEGWYVETCPTGIARVAADASRDKSLRVRALAELATRTANCSAKLKTHFHPWLSRDGASYHWSYVFRMHIIRFAVEIFFDRLVRGLQRLRVMQTLGAAPAAADASPAPPPPAPAAADASPAPPPPAPAQVLSLALPPPADDVFSRPQVWTLGRGHDGQLGHGLLSFADYPLPLPALAGKKVLSLSAYYDHALVVTADNQVWSWGGGTCGATGHLWLCPTTVPLTININMGEALRADSDAWCDKAEAATGKAKVVAVSTGQAHTLALLSNGQVASWGAAMYGATGSTPDMFYPNGHSIVEYDPSVFAPLTTAAPSMELDLRHPDAMIANNGGDVALVTPAVEYCSRVAVGLIDGGGGGSGDGASSSGAGGGTSSSGGGGGGGGGRPLGLRPGASAGLVPSSHSGGGGGAATSDVRPLMPPHVHSSSLACWPGGIIATKNVKDGKKKKPAAASKDQLLVMTEGYVSSSTPPARGSMRALKALVEHAAKVRDEPPCCACCGEPQPYNSVPFERVEFVSAGGLHSACISRGTVYTWGANDGEALCAASLLDGGLEDPEACAWLDRTGCDCCPEPPGGRTPFAVHSPQRAYLKPAALRGAPVQVACGDSITVVRTDKGEVASWGAYKVRPWRVDAAFPAGETARHVCAGGPHCLAVTRPGGLVFRWTRCPLDDWSYSDKATAARAGQMKPSKPPTPVQLPFLSKIWSAECSATHGVALSDDGRVYVWPIGTDRLPGAEAAAGGSSSGAAAACAVVSPAAPHPFEVPLLRNRYVSKIACGDDFVVFATQPPAAALPLPDVTKLILAASSGDSQVVASSSSSSSSGTASAAAAEALDQMGLKKCTGCGMYEEVPRSFKLCGSCRSVHYCSQRCQADHFEAHRPACRAAAATTTKAPAAAPGAAAVLELPDAGAAEKVWSL